MSITVYTKPYCQSCDATKRWLTKRGVQFTETPLEGLVLAEAVAAGFKAAPIVVVDYGASERRWGGFNPDELRTYARRIEGIYNIFDTKGAVA